MRERLIYTKRATPIARAAQVGMPPTDQDAPRELDPTDTNTDLNNTTFRQPNVPGPT